MSSRYMQWMYDWETGLTSVDNNRVVRPLDWGVKWGGTGPAAMAFRPGTCPRTASSSFGISVGGL